MFKQGLEVFLVPFLKTQLREVFSPLWFHINFSLSISGGKKASWDFDKCVVNLLTTPAPPSFKSQISLEFFPKPTQSQGEFLL